MRTRKEKTLTLRELRHHAGRTQEDVARHCAWSQAQVSRFERRNDVLLSSLARYVGALGAQLELRMRFGEEEVCVPVEAPGPKRRGDRP